MQETPSNFKCGFAVLVGRTNAGKSALLNALVGSKIAIVTPKPQTTRNTYHGIVHRPEGQIVFVDTPGIFKTAPSRLVQNLHHRVRDAIEGIDVLVHVADPTRSMGREDEITLDMVKQVKQPKILAINKLDLSDRPHRAAWLALAKDYQAVVEVSALEPRNTEKLIQAIMKVLPHGTPQYPEGQMTNVTTEFWLAEIIREKIFMFTHEEVPYATEVRIQRMEKVINASGNPVLEVDALIVVNDERYKGMLIGAGGRKVKAIKACARKELQVATDKRVKLTLEVATDTHWMDRMDE